MKVLVIGSGGREHALAWKISQSNQVDKVFLAPGNGGTTDDFVNLDIGVKDYDKIIDFSKEEGIDLVIVGPEDPLADGIVDRLNEAGIRAFGPDKSCSRFEASKDFTKEFLNKYGVPTAGSVTVTEYDNALDAIKNFSYPLVIKADGLYAGKGVVIADNEDEAKKTLGAMLRDGDYGDSGAKVVLEEFLEGDEQSLLCFVSNNNLVPMDTARDYKKAYDNDEGENTGGVGVYSPGIPWSDELRANIEETLEKIEKGLEAEGFSYYGILFIGFMIKDDVAKVLEFNVRFGDPETEVLLPRLESDLYDVMTRCLDGELKKEDLVWSSQKALGLVLYSDGYPGFYEKGFEIKGLGDIEGGLVFHNGTKKEDGTYKTAGGRVLTLVSLDDSLEGARKASYQMAEKISCPSLVHRSDIGKI